MEKGHGLCHPAHGAGGEETGCAELAQTRHSTRSLLSTHVNVGARVGSGPPAHTWLSGRVTAPDPRGKQERARQPWPATSCRGGWGEVLVGEGSKRGCLGGLRGLRGLPDHYTLQTGLPEGGGTLSRRQIA